FFFFFKKNIKNCLQPFFIILYIKKNPLFVWLEKKLKAQNCNLVIGNDMPKSSIIIGQANNTQADLKLENNFHPQGLGDLLVAVNPLHTALVINHSKHEQSNLKLFSTPKLFRS
ncbi:hypothetical protein ACJX0J_012055, partial [Zea mays]